MNPKVDVQLTCPLGSKCEEIVEGQFRRCAWYTEMTGQDAQGNDHNTWRCAMAWMPILQVEVAGTNRGQTAAIESLRNETVKRQNLALSQIANAEKLIEKGNA